jgi:hypothetical protein
MSALACADFCVAVLGAPCLIFIILKDTRPPSGRHSAAYGSASPAAGILARGEATALGRGGQWCAADHKALGYFF